MCQRVHDKLAALGYDEKRKPREPAPINCEGTCSPFVDGVRQWTVRMHTFSRHTGDGAEMYACTKCGSERMWGRQHE